MPQDHPISRRELLGAGAAAGLVAQRLVGEAPACSTSPRGS
jgi:uncharacterized protein (DUF1501 family)